VLSRRRRGACARLEWREGRYVCGVLAAQTGGLLGRWRSRLIRRWIAAGAGCDCALEPAGKP